MVSPYDLTLGMNIGDIEQTKTKEWMCYNLIQTNCGLKFFQWRNKVSELDWVWQMKTNHFCPVWVCFFSFKSLRLEAHHHKQGATQQKDVSDSVVPEESPKKRGACFLLCMHSSHVHVVKTLQNAKNNSHENWEISGLMIEKNTSFKTFPAKCNNCSLCKMGVLPQQYSC